MFNVLNNKKLSSSILRNIPSDFSGEDGRKRRVPKSTLIRHTDVLGYAVVWARPKAFFLIMFTNELVLEQED